MSFERYANSSIGKKQMMALTGLMLIGFLLAHLTGNFLIFAGYGNHYEHGNAKIIEEQKKKEEAAKQKASVVKN